MYLRRMSAIEWIAALIAFAGVYLNAMGRIAGWPLGIAGAALYTWVFYNAALPAESTLQFLYVIMGIYGWWQWSVLGSRPDERPVIKITFLIFITSMLIWLSAAVAAGFFISKNSLGKTPYIDAALAVGGLVTTVLLAKKYIENWLFWIIIDLASAALFYYREMYASSLLYIGFTVLAIKGYFEWKKQITA